MSLSRHLSVTRTWKSQSCRSRWPRTSGSLSTSTLHPRSSSTSYFVLGSIVTLIATTSYVVGALRPPKLLELINPPIAPPSPSFDSEEGILQTRRVEDGLNDLEQVKQLRSQSEEWLESRPYLNYREEKKRHQFTAGTLRRPGHLAVAPLVFSTPSVDDLESIIFIHVGRSLCGHDGIVHGGLLATLCDEALARTAILSLPNKIGVTAYLNVTYKSPVVVDQYLILKTKLSKPSVGRKAWAQLTMQSLSGTLLIEAEALFVEPKGAAWLDKTSVNEILGKTTNKSSQ